MTNNEIIKGPGALCIELDSGQIFLDDPGQGTPLLVTLGGLTSSFNCVSGEGEVDGKLLNQEQKEWLESKADYCDEWLTHWVRYLRELEKAERP